MAMSELTTAQGLCAFYRELIEGGIPSELAELLVRDSWIAKCSVSGGMVRVMTNV